METPFSPTPVGEKLDEGVAAVTPIVFLPGALGRKAFWRPVAERLAALGPATLVGYPGFGDEPADPAVRDVDDLYLWLLPRLPAGRFHVVAQSMGGVLGARLAIELPDRVSRLVLTATSGGVDVARLGGADWRGGFRAARPDVPEWFELDRTDLTDRLAAVRAPTLLLWSDADPISPVAVSDLLLARIPGAQRAIIAGGSHSFAEERPAEVAAAVSEFLAVASG
jgi:pimeloyl-ACP methyl ester carboxylesterase